MRKTESYSWIILLGDVKLKFPSVQKDLIFQQLIWVFLQIVCRRALALKHVWQKCRYAQLPCKFLVRVTKEDCRCESLLAVWGSIVISFPALRIGAALLMSSRKSMNICWPWELWYLHREEGSLFSLVELYVDHMHLTYQWCTYLPWEFKLENPSQMVS